MTGQRSEDEALPFCVLTYRKGPNGNEIYDAIPQSSEAEAHVVAEALSRTGQPTWLLTPWEQDMERARYRREDLDVRPMTHDGRGSNHAE